MASSRGPVRSTRTLDLTTKRHDKIRASFAKDIRALDPAEKMETSFRRETNPGAPFTSHPEGASRGQQAGDLAPTQEIIPSTSEIAGLFNNARRENQATGGASNVRPYEERIQKLWAEGAALTMGNSVPTFNFGAGRTGIANHTHTSDGCNIDVESIDLADKMDRDSHFVSERSLRNPLGQVLPGLHPKQQEQPDFQAAFIGFIAAHEGAHCLPENRAKREEEAHADAMAAYALLSRAYRSRDVGQIAATRSALILRLAVRKRQLGNPFERKHGPASAVFASLLRPHIKLPLPPRQSLGYYPLRWALEEPPAKFYNATDEQVRARIEQVYQFLEASPAMTGSNVPTDLAPPPWSF